MNKATSNLDMFFLRTKNVTPRWWGRLGAEWCLVAYGILISVCHLNIEGVVQWQGVDWAQLIARFFRPAWAVTILTAGFLVGYTMGGIVQAARIIASVCSARIRREVEGQP